MVYELSYLDAKKNFEFFLVRVPPYVEKLTKIFFYPNMTIHTPLDSPCRVYKKSVVFGKFYINYWSKIFQKPHFNILNPKNTFFLRNIHIYASDDVKSTILMFLDLFAIFLYKKLNKSDQK